MVLAKMNTGSFTLVVFLSKMMLRYYPKQERGHLQLQSSV